MNVAPTAPEKVNGIGWRKLLNLRFVENVCFVAAAGFAFVFAAMIAVARGSLWQHIVGVLLVWLVLAYLALPRLNQILTSIYVPDYFVGRTRAADGVLGDPVNLAFLGTEDQLHEAMQRAGWHLADPITLRSSWGIVVSSVARRSYPNAPVSPLLLFGRVHDFAYQQEVDGNAAQRHHVRFFRCPPGWILPGGRRVDWLASGSYDTAVGLSWFTLQVTHRIDADIDVERDYIVASLQDAVPQTEVDVIENFSTGYHSRNGGGDRIHTDGDLPVVGLTAVPVTRDHTDLAPADVPHSPGEVAARPPSILLAMVLSLVAIVISLSRQINEVFSFDPTGVSEDAARAVVIAAAVMVAISAIVLLLLAWRMYVGSRLARVGMLVVMALSMAGQVGLHRASLTTLLDVGVDLAVMFALTSTSARSWTGRRRSADSQA